jgi:hypothetical protein
MDALILAETTECWMVYPNVIMQKYLTVQSGGFEVMHVMFFSQNRLCLTIPCHLVQWSMVNITVHSCKIRWDQLLAINNQNCLSTAPLCARTRKHLVIVMCKNWCNSGARKCLAQPPYSPDLTLCDYWLLHMWKNMFSENDLNQKTISTLLSLPIYIVSKRMNTELQLIIYHKDGKSVWTVLVIPLSMGYTCKQ